MGPKYNLPYKREAKGDLNTHIQEGNVKMEQKEI